MLLVTIMVDKAITNTFVVHSFNLPIKIARDHDDEEVSSTMTGVSNTIMFFAPNTVFRCIMDSK